MQQPPPHPLSTTAGPRSDIRALVARMTIDELRPVIDLCLPIWAAVEELMMNVLTPASYEQAITARRDRTLGKTPRVGDAVTAYLVGRAAEVAARCGAEASMGVSENRPHHLQLGAARHVERHRHGARGREPEPTRFGALLQDFTSGKEVWPIYISDAVLPAHLGYTPPQSYWLVAADYTAAAADRLSFEIPQLIRGTEWVSSERFSVARVAHRTLELTARRGPIDTPQVGNASGLGRGIDAL